MSTGRAVLVAGCALMAWPIGARAGLGGGEVYDFSQVTALCEGAVAGVGVGAAIPGFELLLIKDGRVVYRRAFGQWSLDRVANADSATKTVSGALVMSLVDSSPLPFSLDTPLSAYIPAFSGDKAGITIRQCFSHSSGLPANSPAQGSQSLTLQQAAAAIAALPLSYSPGQGFLYGGPSMHAAGAVAELAGGQAWNTLFAQRIAGPLGFSPAARFVLSSPSNPRIAGGMEATAPDFGSLMEMLRVGGVHAPTGVRVLSAASVQQMFTRQSPVGAPVLSTPYPGLSDYGVGVWLDERDAQGSLVGALAAGARGFSAWVDFDDRIVGVIATDLTTSGNVLPWQLTLRAAAASATATGVPCRADIAQTDGRPGPDGLADNGDFSLFFAAFFGANCGPAPCSAPEPARPCNPADIAGTDGTPGPDGCVNNGDFQLFFAAFFAGCP